MKEIIVITLLLLCSWAGYAQNLGLQSKPLLENKSQELGLKSFSHKPTVGLYPPKKPESKVKFPLKSQGTNADLRSEEKARVSSKSGMLILKPNATINYSMLALKPDSTIHYHLRVKKPDYKE